MGRYCPNCPKKVGKPKAKKVDKYIKIYRSRVGVKTVNKKTSIDRTPKAKAKKKKQHPGKEQKERVHHHISRHTYYGVNREEASQKPVEGDTFLNVLNGEWSIYRHGNWSKIPTPGPRTYLGPSTSPSSAVPHPKEGSLYFDAEGRIYVYQAHEWQLVPITMSPSLPSITLKESNTTLTISPDLSNPTLKMNKTTFELLPSEAKIQLEITTSNYYQSLIKPETLGENSLEFPVVPHGKQRVCLSDLKGSEFNFNFVTWNQFTDNDQQTWQTVVGLADFKLFDETSVEIPDSEYSFVSDTDEHLISLMEGKYLTTTNSVQEVKLTCERHISKAEWTYHLLAYPLDSPKQFYLVKDFHDLEKQIDQPLPVVKVQID